MVERHAFGRAAKKLFVQRRELISGAWWSLLAAFISRGSNLAGLIICARVLSQARFGEVAIIQSTVGMFGPVAGLGLAMTTTKFLAEYRDADRARAGRILTLSLMAAAAAGLLMTGGLILFAPLIAARGLAAPGMEVHLIRASGLLFFGVIDSVQTGALTGLEAFSRIARLSAWSGFLSIPLIAVLTLAFGLPGAIAGLTLSLVLSCILNAIALKRECAHYGIRMSVNGVLSESRILMTFSLPSYLSGIIVAPTTWITSALLVRQANGFAEMGIFSAADRFRFMLVFVPLAVSRIAVPALSRFRSTGDVTGYRKALRFNTLFGLIVTVVPALLGAAAAGPLMSLFGKSFERGWTTLAILAVSAVPTVMNTQLGAALLSNNRAWTRMAADVVLVIGFLSSAWILIPRWGANGLAAAYAIGYALACAALLIFLRRAHAAA